MLITAWDLLRIDVQGFTEFCHDYTMDTLFIFYDSLVVPSKAFLDSLSTILAESSMLLTTELPGLHFLRNKHLKDIIVGKDTGICHCMYKLCH